MAEHVITPIINTFSNGYTLHFHFETKVNQQVGVENMKDLNKHDYWNGVEKYCLFNVILYGRMFPNSYHWIESNHKYECSDIYKVNEFQVLDHVKQNESYLAHLLFIN